MKMNDIGTYANMHSGLLIQLPVAIIYANEALAELASLYDSACSIETIEHTNVNANEWVNLPSNCLKVLSVNIDGTKTYRYVTSQGRIRLPEDSATTLSIEYLRKSTDIVSKEETPEINELYHNVLALYIASRERSRKFGDQEKDSQRLMGEFLVKADNVDRRLNNIKGGPKYIGKREFV